jgi:hypothetical protein
MAHQVVGSSTGADDPFRMYASSTGARILQKANKINEDFPTSKYLLFFVIYAVEVVAVFWFGLHLIG